MARPPKFPILRGQRYGLLTVMDDDPVNDVGERRYRTRCDCGVTVEVAGVRLRSGNTKSCGCLKLERTRTLKLSHGHRSNGGSSPTYRSWNAMKTRCLNPRRERYADWGGRGISIAPRWLVFDNFLADMGERPEGTTLDRINNQGNYEPGNCRWATPSEQNLNKGRTGCSSG